MEELKKVIEKYENFTICEAINETKNAFDMLEIVNNLLYNIIELTRYEQETAQDEKNFLKLCKIKDEILSIKNRNIPRF